MDNVYQITDANDLHTQTVLLYHKIINKEKLMCIYIILWSSKLQELKHMENPCILLIQIKEVE